MTTSDGLDAPRPVGSPRAPALRPRRLVGRDREIAEVTDIVMSSSVTTLMGPGGVGKTALAMTVAAACAESFPDGVIAVWLASLRSAELVGGEVAAALGLPKSGGRSYEDALSEWLADRDILLLLDNCEHVVSAVADLVDALTVRLPRLRILATSREPLWVDGEVSYRLAPLPVVGADASLEEVAASPAVQLFRERAGARMRDPLGNERASRLVGEICRRLDGLPLAIELAAARATGLDLQDITSHLDDLFNLLPQPARRADGGQRSLRATVEWSDTLLTEEERRLLSRLSVFVGGFDLTAIKGICATEGQTAGQVADLTARLVDKSLLMKAGDGGRYQLLETIRQYASENLTAVGKADAVRDRHARWFLDAALHEAVNLTTGPERTHIEALTRAEDNVRVALDRLIGIAPEGALALAANLTMFWWVQGKHREGMRWLDRALGAASDAPPELRAFGLFGKAFLFVHDTDDWAAAAPLFDEGIATISGSADAPPVASPVLGFLLCLRGECDVIAGDPKSGVVRTQEGLRILARYPDKWGHAVALWNVGYALLSAGDIEEAIAAFEEIAEPTNGHQALIRLIAYQSLGEISEKRDAPDRARPLYEAALRLRREIGAIRLGSVHGSLPEGLLAVARVAAKQGQLETASTLLHEALPLAEQMREDATAFAIRALLGQTSPVVPARTGTLRPEGGVWYVEFNGKSAHVPDLKGLWHLRELVSRPREPVPALSLIAAPSEDPLPVGDAGPALDREALRQYRKRLAELDAELVEAEARHDVARHAKRNAEREALLGELARATGLGGRPRRTGSPSEKARLNVTRTIRHAITYLSTTVPELAAHLDESLVTGIACCYEPRGNIAWTT
jgi:predicted ATPase